jgi:cytochrome c1
MKSAIPFALAAAALWLLPSLSASADAMSLGEFEYRNSCSACHGPKGDGDGPLAQYLTIQTLPQLSMLQKNNGGVFPVQRVYSVIDGTADVAAHGNRDMPVWGQRYRARIDPETDFEFGPEETEAYVRTRILALIEYLSTIQAK